MSDPVLYTVDHAVATITMNRPASLNSLDTSTKVALRDQLATASADRSVRAVVLTGTGRAFSAGQDLREHAEGLRADDPGLGRTIREHYIPIARTLMDMAKPTVAAVNGVAVGAGASLALACDLRLLASDGGFNIAFAGIGLSCDTGMSWTLPRVVGWAKARELLFLPRTVDAAESVALGLATEVVQTEALGSRAAELARTLASGPTLAYAAIRRSLDHSAVHSFDDTLEFEAEMMESTGRTRDHREAVEAFLAKQEATFRGE